MIFTLVDANTGEKTSASETVIGGRSGESTADNDLEGTFQLKTNNIKPGFYFLEASTRLGFMYAFRTKTIYRSAPFNLVRRNEAMEPTNMGMSGEDIERASFAAIDAEAPAHGFTPAEWAVARRLVHTTADFGLLPDLAFHALVAPWRHRAMPILLTLERWMDEVLAEEDPT